MDKRIIFFMRSIYEYREDFNLYVWGSIFLFILTSKLFIRMPTIDETYQYIMLIISSLLFILFVLRSIITHYKITSLKYEINKILCDLNLRDLYY